MKFLLRYLKSKCRILLLLALFFALFLAIFALYDLPMKALIYPGFLCLFVGAVAMALDYARVKRQHEALEYIKTLPASDIVDLPSAINTAQADYADIVEKLRAELLSHRESDAQAYRDMVDYYTLWAHQIKTPIASMKLTLQNEDSPLSRKLSLDLFRTQQYVDMVLAYLRLDSDSSDFVLKSYSVDDILRPSLRKFAAEFIHRKLALSYEGIEVSLVTDEKWFSFVFEQLLSNALKYTPEGGIIRIFMDGPATLCLSDTGIGIAPEDLPRIFEKGYTGFNGRTDRNASGLGLYLCRRTCQKLGIGIRIASTPGEGTRVYLDFPAQKPIFE